jgi:hypothetical protein
VLKQKIFLGYRARIFARMFTFKGIDDKLAILLLTTVSRTPLELHKLELIAKGCYAV